MVTSLRFDTVAEPTTTRIEAHWSGAAVDEVVTAWQAWAPDAPDELTANLSVVSEPDAPVRATLFGAATLDEERDPGAAARVRASWPATRWSTCAPVCPTTG